MTITIRRYLPILILLAICLLGSGCLEMKQEFSFARDGSCIVTWKFSIPAAYSLALKQAMKTGHDKFALTSLPFWPSDKETVEKYCEANPEIELRQYREYQENGQSRIDIVVLARNALTAFESNAFNGFVLTRDDLGDFTLVRHVPNLKEKFSENELKTLKLMLKKSRFSLTVSVPTAVISSNGQQTKFNQATWTWTPEPGENELDLFDNHEQKEVSLKW